MSISTFKDLYERVLAHYASDPGADQIAEAKQIAVDGIQLFLNSYDWSFIQTTASLTIATTDNGKKALPEDFVSCVDHPTLTGSLALQEPPTLQHRPPEWIRDQVAASNSYKAVPQYYAIERDAYVPATGQGASILVYPWPVSDATLTVPYRYSITMPALDADLLPGGPAHGLAILHAGLVVWESQSGKTAGVMHRLYYGDPRAGIPGYLAGSIKTDSSNRSRVRGSTPPGASRQDWPNLGATYTR